MKRFLCLGLILLVLPVCAMAEGTPPTDWPSVPTSHGSDAFNNPQWVCMPQDCETYQGPGENYAQDEYHEVKANQWIQVFGQEKEWAFILYSPAESIYRFGYCSMSAMPESVDIEPISVWAEQSGTSASAWITSDPLKTLDETLLPQLCPVTYLCAVGDQWLYVELTQLDGKLRRGFIPPQNRYELDMFGDAWEAATPGAAATPMPVTLLTATPEATAMSEPEPSPTSVPETNLSESAAVTLAKNVLLSRFHFTPEQIEALQFDTTNWAGDNIPLTWLIDFYNGDYFARDHVVTVGIDATTGDLRGCYMMQNGLTVWVDADALTDALIAESYPTPTPTPTI